MTSIGVLDVGAICDILAAALGLVSGLLLVPELWRDPVPKPEGGDARAVFAAGVLRALDALCAGDPTKAKAEVASVRGLGAAGKLKAIVADRLGATGDDRRERRSLVGTLFFLGAFLAQLAGRILG